MSRAPFVLLGVLGLAMFDVSLYSSKMLLDMILTLPASRKQEAEADYIGLCTSPKPSTYFPPFLFVFFSLAFLFFCTNLYTFV